MKKKKIKEKRKKEIFCWIGEVVFFFWYFIRYKFDSSRSFRDWLLVELKVKVFGGVRAGGECCVFGFFSLSVFLFIEFLVDVFFFKVNLLGILVFSLCFEKCMF